MIDAGSGMVRVHGILHVAVHALLARFALATGLASNGVEQRRLCHTPRFGHSAADLRQ